jgi:hypothetical protein
MSNNIFYDKLIPPTHIATWCLKILKSYPKKNRDQPLRQIMEEKTDRLGSWAYFDGVAIVCVGRVLSINDSYYLKYKVGLGVGTNKLLR